MHLLLVSWLDYRCIVCLHRAHSLQCLHSHLLSIQVLQGCCQLQQSTTALCVYHVWHGMLPFVTTSFQLFRQN